MRSKGSSKLAQTLIFFNVESNYSNDKKEQKKNTYLTWVKDTKCPNLTRKNW